MAQDTTGTSLVANATANTRQPCFRVLFDWNDQGFANQANTMPAATWDGTATYWCDESANVESIQGEMEGVSWMRGLSAVGSSVASTVYVTLRNPADGSNYRRFSLASLNPTTAPTSLYNYLDPTAPEPDDPTHTIRMKRAIVQVGFTDSVNGDELLNQITGYVTGLEEMNDGRRVRIEIRDRGIDAGQTRVSTTLYQNYTAKAYIEILLALLSRDTVSAYGTHVYDIGAFPLYYAWAEDETIQDELNEIAEAQMGRTWWDKDGNFHFDDGAHFVTAHTNAYDDPKTVQHAFDTGDFRECQPFWDFATQYTKVTVSYTPRYVAGTQNIYEASETWMIPTGATNNINAEFRYPVSSVVTPVANTDYTVVTPGGTDISGSVALVFTHYAGHTKVAATNNHATYAAVLCGLTLRGTPLYPRNRMQYESDATAFDHYNEWRLRNTYVQSYRQAEAIGEYVLSRYDVPVNYIHLRECRGLPWLEIGDRITVTSPNVGTTVAYFVTNVSWQYGPPYTMDIDAIRAGDLFPLSVYAVLGTSVYANADANLFW